jgi:hypothetical protein
MYRIRELLLSLILGISACNARTAYDIQALQSPVIFQGDSVTAFRDPAVVYNDNQVYLYFTLVEIEGDGRVFSYTAQSKSSDLIHWSAPEKITPRDQDLNYCSPGNVVRFQDEWVLCLQTYPRPDHTIDQGTRYGTGDARIFIMRSGDLRHWSEPEILMVKGPGVPVKGMGRMIDPYLAEDVHEEGKWWCFYKQNGASMSYSYDLKSWTYFGNTQAGENVTVLVEDDEYIMFHSPSNGIGIKRSKDLRHWEDWGPLITLGQDNWDWARGRITAATVADLRSVPGIGRYVMFFHGSGPRTEQEGDFDRNASIGIAWSDDLLHWSWPGKSDT